MVTALKVDGVTKLKRMACAAGTTILKNKVLTLSDPRTCAEVSDTTNAGGYIFGGIAWIDKDSTDTSTSITAAKNGIWEVSASGSITCGQFIKSVGTGYFAAAVAVDIASGAICGRALETASDQEVINVEFGGNI